MSNLRRSALSAAVLLGSTGAFAFDLGANWSYLHFPQSVTFSTNIGSWTGSHTQVTAQFLAERQAGAAGGTTTLLAPGVSSFTTYCVEMGQYLPTGYQTHNSVTTLLGSTTTTGGVTGPIVFDAARTDALELLWGTHAISVTDNVSSAAFQLAQWELCFDTDMTLQNTSGRMWCEAPFGGTDSIGLAETWLTGIRTGTATQRQSLLLISDANLQDQVTPVQAVPEPASLAVLGLALAAYRRRRR